MFRRVRTWWYLTRVHERKFNYVCMSDGLMVYALSFSLLSWYITVLALFCQLVFVFTKFVKQTPQHYIMRICKENRLILVVVRALSWHIKPHHWMSWIIQLWRVNYFIELNLHCGNVISFYYIIISLPNNSRGHVNEAMYIFLFTLYL